MQAYISILLAYLPQTACIPVAIPVLVYTFSLKSTFVSHPLISQHQTIFINISEIIRLLHNYKYFASFSVVCGLKIGIFII